MGWNRDLRLIGVVGQERLLFFFKWFLVLILLSFKILGRRRFGDAARTYEKKEKSDTCEENYD
jgi:hypothetical protein